ncbi:MAG: hypothetical protein LBO08_02120 [Rickettsiales bacterium]|nr:hypothetical protein [Rickettsiales bacterium]
MNSHFHRILNRMALFTAVIIGGVILWRGELLAFALQNIWLNGVIIGASLFGIGLCFSCMFALVPEYNWFRRFAAGRDAALPPRILRPVAITLAKARGELSPESANHLLEMVAGRFEDTRESIRYITNLLIFLGLLGTFWGLIHTLGGFSDLVAGLNFADADIMVKMQNGLRGPLSGMGIAFTSSLFGLAGSLVIGFLALQVNLAQGTIFRELEEHLAAKTKNINAVPLESAALELTKAVRHLEKTISLMERENVKVSRKN